MDHTIVHFEIPADDVERATRFYKDVFGWEIEKAPGMDYWMVRTVPTGEMNRPLGAGVNGAIMPRMHQAHPLTNYIGVEDVDAYIAKLAAAGATIVVPKMPVPGMGWLAQFKDPEGNVLAIWQPDLSAA